MSDDEDERLLGSSSRITADTPPNKKAKQWYQQAFCDEWLADSELKDWVKPDPGNRYAAICTVCSSSLTHVNKTAKI